MNAETQEWIEKAEGDYQVALREYRVRANPCYDAVCFHAQQSVEKYLKSALASRVLTVRKLHDLGILLQDLLAAFPLWVAMVPDMERLSQYAVKFRYPGEKATRTQAQKAVMSLKRCRATIRESMGLKP